MQEETSDLSSSTVIDEAGVSCRVSGLCQVLQLDAYYIVDSRPDHVSLCNPAEPGYHRANMTPTPPLVNRMLYRNSSVAPFAHESAMNFMHFESIGLYTNSPEVCNVNVTMAASARGQDHAWL